MKIFENIEKKNQRTQHKIFKKKKITNIAYFKTCFKQVHRERDTFIKKYLKKNHKYSFPDKKY